MSVPDEATRESGTSIERKSVGEAVTALSDRFGQQMELGLEESESDDSEEATEDLGEVVEEVEVEDEEVDQGTEETGESPEQPEEEEAEEDTFRTIDELLEAGGVQPADLTLVVRVDGENREVTLEEAVRGYQRQSDYDRRMSEIRSEKERLKDVFSIPEIQEKLKIFDDTVQLASMTLNAESQALRQHYENIDWDTLRRENPAEYSATMADFQRQQQDIQERQHRLLESYQGTVQERDNERRARMEQVMTQERRALQDLHPELRDESAFEERRKAVHGYLQSTYGATDAEINSLVDHRIHDIAWKASEYDRILAEGKAKVQGGKKGKKLRKKVTRTLKPGASVRRVTSAKGNEVRAREQLSQTHTAQDAQQALLARWGTRK